jgi:parvulin-like peptidyl-prolyl isomerase
MRYKFCKIVVFLALACHLASAACFAATLDKVIVVVNGETITQSELDAACEIMRQKLTGADLTGEALAKELENGRKEILSRMIEEKLILSAAKKKKIEADEEDIEQKMQDVKSRFGSEDNFYATLKDGGVSINELRENYANQIRVGKMVDMEVRKKVVVAPADIAGYYDAHKEDFREPEQVRLKNILIRPGEGLEDGEAAALAEKILGFLKAGENFDELALKYSKGPNADMGGDLGLVKRGQMLKPIEDAVFNLNAGDLSGVIKTSLGYHIFRVEERRPERVKGLNEVREEIQRIIFAEKGKKQYDSWIEQLKKDSYISYR